MPSLEAVQMADAWIQDFKRYPNRLRLTLEGFIDGLLKNHRDFYDFTVPELVGQAMSEATTKTREEVRAILSKQWD
jgi:hypothetical protein